jgi:hypothetical protein
LHHAIHRSVTGHELCSGSTLAGGWKIPHKTIAESSSSSKGKVLLPKGRKRGVFGEMRCQSLEDGQKVMVSVLPERQRVSEGAIDRGHLHRDDVYLLTERQHERDSAAKRGRWGLVRQLRATNATVSYLRQYQREDVLRDRMRCRRLEDRHKAEAMRYNTDFTAVTRRSPKCHQAKALTRVTLCEHPAQQMLAEGQIFDPEPRVRAESLTPLTTAGTNLAPMSIYYPSKTF